MKKPPATSPASRAFRGGSVACLLFLQSTVAAEPPQSQPTRQFIKLVTDRIGAAWYPAANQKLSRFRTEQVRVTFRVNHASHIQSIRVSSPHGADALVLLTVAVLKSVKFPPLPPEIPAGESMKFQFDFSVE